MLEEQNIIAKKRKDKNCDWKNKKPEEILENIRKKEQQKILEETEKIAIKDSRFQMKNISHQENVKNNDWKR